MAQNIPCAQHLDNQELRHNGLQLLRDFLPRGKFVFISELSVIGSYQLKQQQQQTSKNPPLVVRSVSFSSFMTDYKGTGDDSVVDKKSNLYGL